MLSSYTVEVAVLLIITLMYAIFDVFNKRNIPDLIVYATIIIGIIIVIVYNFSILWLDFEIAVAIGLVGFVVYRAGFLGAGDVLELIFISLVLPIQGAPSYSGISQLGTPFIFSVIIGAGYTATIFIPLYYLFVKRIFNGKGLSTPSTKNAVLGMTLLIAYIIFTIVFTMTSSIGRTSIELILLLAFAAFFSLIFEKDIYTEMTMEIYPKDLEEGDMVALNLMRKSDIAYFKRRYSGFGRLTTRGTMAALKNVKRRMPVYRDSVAFSLFIFFGVVISLAVGNLIFIVIGL